MEGSRKRRGEMEVRLFGSRERGSREDASWGADPWRGVFTTATGGARLGSIFGATPFFLSK